MTITACGADCDFQERQLLIQQSTLQSTMQPVTIQALYWGIHCSQWHYMTLNSIGSAYPSHYVHFDRQIALKGSTTATAYYITDNIIEIPRTSPAGDLSCYALCYLPQANMDDNSINKGFSMLICANVRYWYGPVLLFATDPRNHVRRVQTEDTGTATETISR